MAKIIYHKGTGTYFGLDDDVVIIDLDRIPEKIDAEVMDDEGDEIATYWGTPIRLYPDNCIDFSPQALRDEASTGVDNWNDPDCKWVTDEATDKELNVLGIFILNDPEIWEMFHNKVMQGFRDRKVILGSL